jgi:hypothetical protein
MPHFGTARISLPAMFGCVAIFGVAANQRARRPHTGKTRTPKKSQAGTSRVKESMEGWQRRL